MAQFVKSHNLKNSDQKCSFLILEPAGLKPGCSSVRIELINKQMLK